MDKHYDLKLLSKIFTISLLLFISAVKSQQKNKLDSINKYYSLTKNNNIDLLNRLIFSGLNFTQDDLINNSLTLSNIIFVISGVFENYSRDELKSLIEKNGGKISSSISSKTNYLVAGKNIGPSKFNKANE